MITLLRELYSRLKSIHKTSIENVVSNYSNLDILKSIDTLIVEKSVFVVIVDTSIIIAT